MLLPVAVALAVFAAWLIALDHYHGLALAISPVVLPFTTGAVFLAFGPLLREAVLVWKTQRRLRDCGLCGRA
jgi:ABC-type sulfate transport system permease subunit